MKKLTLSLDALAVESFGTVDATPDDRGTVRGQGAGVALAPSMFDHTACSCPYTCPKPTRHD